MPVSTIAAKYRLLQISLAALTLVGLAACGGGGGGGGGAPTPPQPPNVQASTASLNVIGTAPSTVTGSVTATDPQGLALTYSIAQNPSIGTATVNSSTGAFSYSIPGNTTGTSDTFTVTVSNGKATANGTVTVQLHGDPLLANQWHIQNTGGTAFSTTFPTAGNDMNVAGAWAAGYTGKGVKVAVVDTGLEIAHEDLAANVDTANSYNFVTGTTDPTPNSATIGFDHGTQVAGIIAAVAFNGKGGRGVAYNARLRGYNLLSNYNLTNYGAALGGMATSADNAIFSASFTLAGTGVWAGTVLPPLDQTQIAISGNLDTLRGGLGAILVNAAGNDFTRWEHSDGTLPTACNVANQLGVSCGDPAHDTRLGGTTPIIVGALNADGKKSSYSTTGSSLWVSAPGGEFGYDSNYIPTSQMLDPANGIKPAIVTTARDGCTNAQNAPGKLNALDSQGSNAFAANCQYTAVMNGTSSATPNVSAAVALMLEANPNLGFRDVKFILAKTAKKVDPTFSGVSSSTIISGTTVVLDRGWFQNAAGYWYSTWYGFGGVDATAAVNMAKTYTSYLPAQQSTSIPFSPAQNYTVPPASTTPSFMTFVAAPSFSTVEQVVLVLNLSSTPALYCNQVELVSPSGTKSILLHIGTGYYANGAYQGLVVNGRLLSNAFYGETAAGTWTLTVFDFCGASATSTVLATTDVETLIIAGH